MVALTSTTYLMGILAIAGVSALPQAGPGGPGGFGGFGGKGKHLPSGLPSSCIPKGPRPTARPTGPPPGLPSDCSSFFSNFPMGGPGAGPTGAHHGKPNGAHHGKPNGAPDSAPADATPAPMEERAAPPEGVPDVFESLPSSCRPSKTPKGAPITHPTKVPKGLPADCTAKISSALEPLITGSAAGNVNARANDEGDLLPPILSKPHTGRHSGVAHPTGRPHLGTGHAHQSGSAPKPTGKGNLDPLAPVDIDGVPSISLMSCASGFAHSTGGGRPKSGGDAPKHTGKATGKASGKATGKAKVNARAEADGDMLPPQMSKSHNGCPTGTGRPFRTGRPFGNGKPMGTGRPGHDEAGRPRPTNGAPHHSGANGPRPTPILPEPEQN